MHGCTERREGGGVKKKRKSTWQHDESLSLKDDGVGEGATVVFNRSRCHVKQIFHNRIKNI